MIDFSLYAETDEERIKQLTGIARLHVSIAREIMNSDRPLSNAELENMLELLLKANEAKYLAEKMKSTVETKETA